jgi:muramoyltetrapeptide carboxypeptidase
MVGVVSPASTPQAAKVQAGLDALHMLGYGTRLYPHALDRGPLYYAGTAAERVLDLHAAFADPEIDAVICTRGGWGSAELLPLLDRDLIRANPKPFLGYSDHTSLHLWLRNEAGMVSFQAPMVAADFSKSDGVDLASWRSALEGSSEWSLGPESGLRVLRSGVAEGELGGGCLAIYAESLGAPWAAKNHGGVLMLEDIHVKPFQWDRMLVHLRHAGMLEGVEGICFGDMRQSCSAEEQSALEASLLHALVDFKGPIAIGLRSGHVDHGNITLPFGVRVRLDLTSDANPQMHFLEAAVQV